MELTLTDREAQVLKGTINAHISEMLLEIARTDNREMRDGLKVNEGILESLLGKLKALERTAA